MLDKEKSKRPGSFGGFELETLLNDEVKQKELLTHVEKNIFEIKNQLRAGTKPEDFDKLGVLLHGYSALLKIITRAATN